MQQKWKSFPSFSLSSHIKWGSATSPPQQQPTSWYFWLLRSAFGWPGPRHTTWLAGLHPSANRTVTVSHCPCGNTAWFACESVASRRNLTSCAPPPHNLTLLPTCRIVWNRASQTSSEQLTTQSRGWVQLHQLWVSYKKSLNSLSPRPLCNIAIFWPYPPM